MPELIKSEWRPALTSGLSRRDRSGCDYEAFVPDPLGKSPVVLEGSVSADIADAERAIHGLNRTATGLTDSEGLARLLIRAESVASSKIEGLEVGGRRLLKAQLASAQGVDASDRTALAVLNNIHAMRWAIDSIDPSGAVELEHILEIHRVLMSGTEMDEHAGRLREVQNWIGGSDWNPCSAAFVPPPPDRVEPLMRDLCRFMSGDDLPALAQAAVVHAQFETVHPFVDGNGRVGRALIHVILRRRGLAPRVVPPISLVLATRSREYIDGLNLTRGPAAVGSEGWTRGLNSWLATFASAALRSVRDAEAYERKVAEIQAAWRRRLARVRADSAVDRLLRALPGAPVITVASGADLIGRSPQAVNQAIPTLVEAGVLRQTTIGRRNRAFEATELIDAFTDLERTLASRDGDTRHSPPSRPAPRRR